MFNSNDNSPPTKINKEVKMHKPMKTTIGTAAAYALLGLSSIAQAGSLNADFSINNVDVDSLVNNQNKVTTPASIKQKFRYTGNGANCSDTEWFIRKTGESQWDNFDHTEYAEQIFHRTGSHELKMTVDGYTNWLTFCFRGGQYDERTVTLDVPTPGLTQTKYPIMLVPGVMGYDDILSFEYFYQVGDEIRKTSDQNVLDVALHPWMDTEERGADLAGQIMDFIAFEQDDFDDPDGGDVKVNLIAHSHGATTSRVALKILADELGDAGKIASLTTVAGPHYGTPTADGAQWAVENWDGINGTIVEDFMLQFLFGDIVGGVVALASGHPEYAGNQNVKQVLLNFTQKGMARFNTCYPSAGVPTGAKYFIEDNFNPSTQQLELPIVDGSVQIDDCQNFSASVNGYEQSNFYSATASIEVTDKSDDAYGAGTIDFAGPVFGDGKGNSVNGSAGNAIRYYSFTGQGEWNTTLGTEYPDVVDVALLIINSMFTLTGERTESDYLLTWLTETGANLLDGTPVTRNKGYSLDSDAFIPVNSTKFGEFMDTFSPWNHVDEQNGIIGMVSKNAPRPLRVYAAHVNRLQQDGL
jgi:triacylglycerol esterase/lipase EstA (alpha/beta hydrolase family)